MIVLYCIVLYMDWTRIRGHFENRQ